MGEEVLGVAAAGDQESAQAMENGRVCWPGRGRVCVRSRRRAGQGWRRQWGRRKPAAGRRRAGGRRGAWRHGARCAKGEPAAWNPFSSGGRSACTTTCRDSRARSPHQQAGGQTYAPIAQREVDGAVQGAVVNEDETMAQKVAAKNAIKPEATAMSRLANQPRLPRGTPKR